MHECQVGRGFCFKTDLVEFEMFVYHCDDEEEEEEDDQEALAIITALPAKSLVGVWERYQWN